MAVTADASIPANDLDEGESDEGPDEEVAESLTADSESGVARAPAEGTSSVAIPAEPPDTASATVASHLPPANEPSTISEPRAESTGEEPAPAVPNPSDAGPPDR